MDCPRSLRLVSQLIANSSSSISNNATEFWTKSNETRYLLVNATTRRDEDNNIVGVVGVAQASPIVCCLFCWMNLFSIFESGHFSFRSVGSSRNLGFPTPISYQFYNLSFMFVYMYLFLLVPGCDGVKEA